MSFDIALSAGLIPVHREFFVPFLSEKDSAVVGPRPCDRGRLVFLVRFATLLDYYFHLIYWGDWAARWRML